jgi:CO/xanthine dehydrogenase FAD-binding subunit
MRLRKFEFMNPSSLMEAVHLLEGHKGKSKLIAGGTDLIVQMKEKRVAPEVLINLGEVSELKRIERNGDVLRIGSMVTHSTLESSSHLTGTLGILASAAGKVGSPQIRSRGTIGGNICHASPSADTTPALLVLDAEVCLVSPRGERRLPLESFFTGPGLTVLEKDEMLKEVVMREPSQHSSAVYLKLGRRKSMDLALVSIALHLTQDSKTGVCKRARIALGSVSPTPVRAKETEKILEGNVLDETAMQEARKRVQTECLPITDIRASAAYRKEMVGVLMERALKQLIGFPIHRIDT